MKTPLLWLLLVAAAWGGPIHDAVLAGQTTRVQELAAADPRSLASLDGEGMTPLILAIHEGKADMVVVLLAAGAGPNLGTPQHWTPLHEAASSDNPDLVAAILKAGGKVDSRESQNSGTPLHIACFHGNLAVCRLLINAGANVNARDREGLTPLWHAKDQGHPELVKLLKQAGGR